ncbi:MAG: hypothetical protein JRJ79_15575 [Deltaproteobacteria bacterium]|nr:hypothetical protein [Deltaproteobacteria bacterium]
MVSTYPDTVILPYRAGRAGEMTKTRKRMSFTKLDVLQHRRKATLIKTFLAFEKIFCQKKHESHN